MNLETEEQRRAYVANAFAIAKMVGFFLGMLAVGAWANGWTGVLFVLAFQAMIALFFFGIYLIVATVERAEAALDRWIKTGKFTTKDVTHE